MNITLKKLAQKMKLWDGTNEVSVNASNELQVRDDDANTALDSIAAEDFSTETTLALINTLLSSATDSTTKSLSVLDYSHVELHSGDHFVCRSYESIAKNGVKELLLITPNTARWAHMVVGFESVTSSIIVEFFKGTTVSANGNLCNTINRNGNFPDDNTTLLYEDPTVTTDGSLLSDGFFGAGKNSAGGGTRDEEEQVLDQNTIYLLRITEQNVSATVVNYSFDWYEHTNS